MRLKKLLTAAAVVTLAAQPVVASAQANRTAASKLSLQNAVPADARASAKPGKSKALSTGLLLLLIAGAVTTVVLVADGGSDSN